MSPKISFLGKMKISNRLTLVYSVMVVLILLIFTACTLLSVYVFANYQSNRLLSITATTVVNGITQKDHLFQNDWDDITVGKDLYVVIYSWDGQILRMPHSLEEDDDLIEDASLVVFGRVFRDGFFDDAAYINRSIMLGDEVFIVQIIMDCRTELRMITILATTLFILLALGAVASVLMGRKMSRQMLKPIGTMIEDANNIQLKGVSSERLKLNGQKDELNDLGITINAMLDRIEGYSSTLTQFVSDASHELRTPITVVLSYAEMLKKWAKDDKEALEKSIDCIEKEALGMKTLIERLLLLARSDTKNLQLTCERLQLDELITEVFQQTALIAGDRRVMLLQNDAVSINSDSNRLKELLRIILENAIKYTKANGEICISSKASNQYLQIIIRDDGIGIKKTDLDKIFDRFYCSETSRNKRKSGSGLGLSIAKSLAEELGFAIRVQSEEGVFTQFSLIKVLTSDDLSQS